MSSRGTPDTRQQLDQVTARARHPIAIEQGADPDEGVHLFGHLHVYAQRIRNIAAVRYVHHALVDAAIVQPPHHLEDRVGERKLWRRRGQADEPASAFRRMRIGDE
jgi:hypothetical protein